MVCFCSKQPTSQWPFGSGSFLHTLSLSCKHGWRLLVAVAFSACTFISLIPLLFFQYCINVFRKTARNSIITMLCSQDQIQSAAALGASSWFRSATLPSAAMLDWGLLGWGAGWCTFCMHLKLESVPERLDKVPLWKKTLCNRILSVATRLIAVVWVNEMLSWISSHPMLCVGVQCSLPRFF